MEKPKVSRAWLDDVFKSPPRRNIDRDSKSTTRFPVFCPGQYMPRFAEGLNEFVAMLIQRHLQLLGIVKRFKGQAFALEEIGGPEDRVPDLLVELADESLHVIQCKARRFVTTEVQAKFDQERSLLEAFGFNFHVWTDRDIVGRPTSQSIRLLDRGYQNPPERSVIERIRDDAGTTSTLDKLLLAYGWDDAIGAAAHGAFHFDITKELHEKTTITQHHSIDYARLFFERRPISDGWWSSLST